MPFTKRYRLQTVSGAKLYHNGRLGSKAVIRKRRCKSATMDFTSTDSAGSPENRERNRKRAEEALGEPCVWVEDGQAEYFPIW